MLKQKCILLDQTFQGSLNHTNQVQEKIVLRREIKEKSTISPINKYTYIYCHPQTDCFVVSQLFSVHVVHPYSCIDSTASWKKSCFILSNRSEFDMSESLSIAVHAFDRCVLTSHSLDETLLPRYVNVSTNFRGSSVLSV